MKVTICITLRKPGAIDEIHLSLLLSADACPCPLTGYYLQTGPKANRTEDFGRVGIDLRAGNGDKIVGGLVFFGHFSESGR